MNTNDFNWSSINAMDLAEELVRTAKKNNFTLEQVLDESWLVGWFANYWAAVHDPMAREIQKLKHELWQIRQVKKFLWYPICLDGEWRWLEYVWIKQIYFPRYDYWKNLNWIGE